MKNLTELVFILDRSGSMSGLEQDTIGGYNSFLENQKKVEGDALVTTVLFSCVSKVIHDRVPIQEIKPMTELDYRVGGSTSLLDAIGQSIDHISTVHKYIRREDVPEKTIFVITTDGQENSSLNYSSSKVKAMIKEKQEKQGWIFMFLADNIDAVETARGMGISSEYAASYDSRNETPSMFSNVSCCIANIRRPTFNHRRTEFVERMKQKLDQNENK